MKFHKTLVIISLIIALLALCSCNITPEELLTTEPNTLIADNGWAAPVYENIDAAQFDTNLFDFDDYGHIIYNDDNYCSFCGIDVSQFQGDVDWGKVASDGIDFVMLRIGFRGYGPSGLIYPDDNFETNYINAKNAGLKVGVYFFSQSISTKEAEQEAAFVIENIKDKVIDYPVAYDWEHVEDASARTTEISSEDVTSFAEAFSKYISHKGYDSVIYFNCSDGYSLLNLDRLSDYNFWLAEYDDKPSFYYNYSMWQYSDKGTVNGISGHVDMNVCLKPANKP